MPDIQINLSLFLNIASGEGGIVDEISGFCQMIVVIRRTHMDDLVHRNMIVSELLFDLFPGTLLNSQDFFESAVFRAGKFCQNSQNIAFQGNSASGRKKDLASVDRHFFIKGVIKRIPGAAFEFSYHFIFE